MDDLDEKLDLIDEEYKKNQEEKEVEAEEKAAIFEEVDVPKSNYETVEVKKVTKDGSYFDGGLIELIGYRILGFLITVFTLGIARSWAICLIEKYKINHTVLNGKRLKFEGTGSSLFVQRLNWFLLSIITLGIYLLWKPVKMLKWEISQIHFEDEEYISGESFFDAGLIKLIGINILCGLVNLLTLGIAYPVSECMKLKWIAKHTIINKKKIVFTGNGVSLFLHRLLWTLLTIVTLGIFGLWLGIMHMKFYAKNTHIKKNGEEDHKDLSDIIILFVFFVVGSLFGFMIVHSSIKNLNISGPSNANKMEVEQELSSKLDGGAEEVVRLMKQRNDVSAGAKDYINTIDSLNYMSKKGLKGYYYYSTTTFINGFDYDLNFVVAYKGYYCEKYYRPNEKRDIECYYLTESNGESDFFKKPLYLYFTTLYESLTHKDAYYSVN